MKKSQTVEDARIAAHQATRTAVLALATKEEPPRVIARRLQIQEVDVTIALVYEVKSAYRRGLERGRQSAMPNLPQAA